MSSTATAAAPAAAIHPSWWARAATWLKHEAVTVKNTILKIAGATPAITSAISQYAPTVEALTGLVNPTASSFESHLVDVWSVVASAVDAAGEAAGANGLNVSLDANLVGAVKSFLPAVKAKMSAKASSSPAS